MHGLKDFIPFQGESVGSLRIRKLLSFVLITGLLQTLSWTYQIIEAPPTVAATTYTPTSNPTGATWTVPTGVDTITFTALGGGAGQGGLDGAGNTVRYPGPRGYVSGSFRLASGTVLGFYPGRAGANGTTGTNTGGGAGGIGTYPTVNYSGGTGGNAGTVGSSGGGGGGGAATVITVDGTIYAVAGGAGGAGGSANWAGSGQDGLSTNTSNTGVNSGGNGVQTSTSNAGSGKNCTNSTNDGGGGGGGGGGSFGGSGGGLQNAGTGECSGLGGSRGNNYLISNSALTSTISSTDPSASNSNNASQGSVSIAVNLSVPSSISISASIQSFTVSWATAAAAQSFRVKIYNSAGNSLLQTLTVASGTYSKTITSADFASIATNTTYQVSVTAIGNSEAPYIDSAESAKFSVTTNTPSDTDSALSLNGSTQYAAANADESGFDIDNAITLEAWIYPTGASCNGNIAGKATSYFIYCVSGVLNYALGGASAWSGVSTGISIPINEWHHVALTRAANTPVANIYVDGHLVYSGTADGAGNAALTNSAAPNLFNIGARNGSATFFTGQIDEVKLWNVARTQTQIQGDLKTYGGNFSDGLIAYYDFNDTVVSILVNKSTGASSSLNLTLVGSPSLSSDQIISSSNFQAYTVVQFFRSFLVANGGWLSPASSKRFRFSVTGGGGGGGNNVGGGGAGGGNYRVTNTTLLSSQRINVIVGVGGFGGLQSFDGTTRMDGQSGDSSTVNINGVTYIGRGGSGGETYWSNNVCGGSGTTTTWSTAGGFSGSGGTGFNGGLGGSPSTFQATANGSAGYIDSTTGTSQYLGAGGGAGGGWNSNVAGVGANSVGGNGSATSAGSGNNGVKNSGSGGGGGAVSCGKGGNGGSGIVILRYITNDTFITTQPLNDTTTVGLVDSFTVGTTAIPNPLTKSVMWQFTSDTTTSDVSANWQTVSLGSGSTTDTYTTQALTSSLNKYRYRAVVTFFDVDSLTVIETSTAATITINPAISISSDTSTITRKYGETQTVRTITYSGGTTSTGAVGTSTSHTVRGGFGTLAGGKIVLDTSTTTAVFRVDTGTVVGSYVETITVTDFKGATATYTQRVVVNPADTLTVASETPTATTYTGAQAIFTETTTVTGLVAGDTVSGLTYNYSASSATCANGGLCNVGDIGPSGGYVFYVSQTVINVASGISTGGIYLEAAPVAAQGTAEFGCTGTQTPGTSYAVGSGAANTKAIIDNCATAGIAARVTSNLTYAGFSDWFMPSLDEMTAIYNNLYNRTPSLGGFTGLDYGSSSQGTFGAGYQAYWWFGAGALSGQTNKNLAVAYRPVRAFNPIYTSSINYGPSTTKPTNAGTYTITPSAVVLANNVNTSNYVFVDYRTSTFTINKARQDTLTVTSVLGVYETGTATMQLTTLGGTDTGTVTYTIATGGTASGCSVSSNVLTVTSAGTCRLAATKAATLNYLIAYSDTATITFSRFVSRPLQVQLYPSMIPLNQGNALETNSVTASTLLVSSITRTGAGAYTITGTGFSNIEVVRIGGTDLTGSNYTVGSVTSITLNAVSSLMGPLFIRRTDGQEVVNFQVTWN